jgi:hypothetical protein
MPPENENTDTDVLDVGDEQRILDNLQDPGTSATADADSALLDRVRDALQDEGFSDQVAAIDNGDIVSIEQIKGGILRDLRAADDLLAADIEDRKGAITLAREDQERAAEAERIEAERVEAERVEQERQRKGRGQ